MPNTSEFKRICVLAVVYSDVILKKRRNFVLKIHFENLCNSNMLVHWGLGIRTRGGLGIRIVQIKFVR